MAEPAGAHPDGGTDRSARIEFARDDLTAGLRELVSALAGSPEPVRLRLVGGAAISLVYDADRRSTVDIDGLITPRGVVLDVARAIAGRRGWRDDWVNDAAAQFLPGGYGGREQEWVTVHDDGHVVIEVGSAPGDALTPRAVRIAEEAIGSGTAGRVVEFPALD